MLRRGCHFGYPYAAIIALIITALALTLTRAAVLSTNQTIPLSGTINAINLGVYSDGASTQTVTALLFPKYCECIV